MKKIENILANALTHNPLTGFLAKEKREAGWLVFRFQSDGLNYVHMRRTESRPEANLCGWVNFAITETEAFNKLSRRLAANRFSSLLVLERGEYQLLLVEAPKVPQDEMRTAIRWKIKDMIDYGIEDASIDLLEIPPAPTQPFKEKSVYAVVAKNEIIQDRMNRFSAAKIPLSAIDIPETAQRNIAALFEKEERGLALLSFGDKEGLLTITFQGELYLSRYIEIPFSLLQERQEDSRARIFDKIVLEIQRSLDHFDHQYNFISLDRLLLGPLPRVDGLAEYLAQNLQLPVEKIELGKTLDFSATPELLEPEWQQRCWFSLGAALRGEIA